MEIYRISNNTLEVVNFKDFKKAPEERYWIIAEPVEIYNHNDFFRFHKNTLEECKSNKQHPRLEEYDDVSFGVLNIIEHIDNWFDAKELNFYLRKNYLVFVCKDKNKLVEQIKKEMLENIESSSNYSINESKILYMLLDRLTSMDNVILKKIEMNIAALEEQVISGEEKDYTVQIIQLRKQLLYLKRHYEPLIDIAESIEENENGLIDESAIRYFTMLMNRIQRLNNNVVHLRDYVTQVREAYQAQVDIKLNKTMKFYTVITTIFLPLTLVAGWYGMNFTHMPELDWLYGYPFVMCLSAVVVIVCLTYFKRHNYL